MISIGLEMYSLQLDRAAQTVIRNDANNRSRHSSGYYKQTDGSLPGWVWKSGEILEALERKVMSLTVFPCWRVQTQKHTHGVLVKLSWQAKL